MDDGRRKRRRRRSGRGDAERPTLLVRLFLLCVNPKQFQRRKVIMQKPKCLWNELL